ncbi:hypothetical protein ASC77_11235 [Nocardioides sp. Root1257]|nr:hypothetical protein ASC77_11235 [Nocardioides sp. Root1257]KRC48427.1 hypothetical protein ASE24_11240 [Nocardioides sp. Root224]
MSRTRVLSRPIVLLLALSLALVGLGGTSVSASAVTARHITGTVTGTDGVPLGNITVIASFFCSCEGFGPGPATQTADDGTYDLYVAASDDSLTQDTAFVSFEDPTGVYATEFYNNAVSVWGSYGIGPQGASGVDVRLELSGHIAGTVAEADGTPIAGASVTVDFADPNDSGWLDTRVRTKTAEDGSYDVSRLPASTYSLTITSPYGTVEYPKLVVAAGTTVRRNVRFPYAQQVDNRRRPRIVGKAKVGHKVTAKPGAWNPSRVTLRYRWVVGGRPVARATHASYRLRAADVGKRLRVRVTASAPKFRSRTVTSEARTIRAKHSSPRTRR